MPSKAICDDFFAKNGGRNVFLEKGERGARVEKDGLHHDCSARNGPGEFGWCPVNRFSVCSAYFFNSFSGSEEKRKFLGFLQLPLQA